MSAACSKCGKPMLCGQPDTHLSCMNRCPDCGAVLAGPRHTCPKDRT